MMAAWILLAAQLLFLLAAASAAVGEVGEACSTPEATAGVCQPIRRCPALVALLVVKSPAQRAAALRYLHSCSCGTFVGLDPVVCCPNAIANATANAIANATANATGLVGETAAAVTNSKVLLTPSRLSGVDDADDVVDGASAVFDEDAERDVSVHPNVDMINGDSCGQSFVSKIWGGMEADLSEFPWMALLVYKTADGKESLNCGGSLITARYVLTAAHCVVNPPKVTLWRVRLGEHDTRNSTDCEFTPYGSQCAPPAQDVAIQAVFAHPRYNATRLVNDVALVRLAVTVQLNTEYVQPICLPVGRAQQFDELAGVQLTVAGWGANEKGSRNPVLLKARLLGMDVNSCAAIYRRHGLRILARHLCAGGLTQRADACKGDSGGPLKRVIGSQTFQVGVVSFGTKNCAVIGYPGVYTHVGRFMKWILDTMHP